MSLSFAALRKMSALRLARRVHEGEEGITALETAIILIAFVVVAAVFAFTVLSAGTFSTERSKEAVYAGLTEVQSTMEVKGGVIAMAASAGSAEEITDIIFTLSSAIGGEGINITDTTDLGNVVTIEYRDATQRVTISDWTVNFLVGDGDFILESGELAEITVPLTDLTNDLSANTNFVIEIKPPTGSVLSLQRTTPAYIEIVNDLH